jgi:hypothetical protein
MIICASGIIAALYPKRCSSTFEHQKVTETAISDDKNPQLRRVVKGHHLSCGGFTAHIIEMKGRILCAACTGLFLGATFAVIGTVAYFFAGWQIRQFSFLAVVTGQLGVLLGFIQFKFKGFMRLAFNVIFVLGAYLILVGMDALAENAFIDFYLILLVVLWIWTRILLSQWDHKKICGACKLECKLKER